MPEVVVASPDRSPALSGGTPAWISLALGLCIFGSLFVIASVIVLSLIPLYLSTKTVTVSNTDSVSSPMTHTFSSGYSPSSSGASVTNTAGVARQLEKAAGLSANTLVVESGSATSSSSSSSGKRRRQTSSDPEFLPHCNGSSTNPTELGFIIRANHSYCVSLGATSKESCKKDLYNLIKTKLENIGLISLYLEFSDKSSATISAQRCRKFSGVLPGIGSQPPPSNACLSCNITINTGLHNFFIGNPNATNLTSIFTNGNITRSTATTYVGYPAYPFSGSCADLCRFINAVCDSDYAFCSLDVGNYTVCSIVPNGGACLGIALYNDPDARSGGNPGSPVTCNGSTNYCCCSPRP